MVPNSLHSRSCVLCDSFAVSLLRPWRRFLFSKHVLRTCEAQTESDLEEVAGKGIRWKSTLQGHPVRCKSLFWSWLSSPLGRDMSLTGSVAPLNEHYRLTRVQYCSQLWCEPAFTLADCTSITIAIFLRLTLTYSQLTVSRCT